LKPAVEELAGKLKPTTLRLLLSLEDDIGASRCGHVVRGARGVQGPGQDCGAEQLSGRGQRGQPGKRVPWCPTS
jgi:hypothetical protein